MWKYREIFISNKDLLECTIMISILVLIILKRKYQSNLSVIQILFTSM